MPRLSGVALVATACLVGLTFRPAVVAAREPMALPVFEIATLDGQRVPSTQLGGEGHWLLVAVDPRALPSRSLLSAVGDRESLPSAGRIVVVVAGTVEDARRLRAGSKDLADASWYADPSRESLALLRVKSLPTVLGVSARQIDWALQGTLADPAKLRSILRSWIAE
jgi:hypothetical protein